MERTTGIDTTAPVAGLQATDVTAGGAATHEFQVAWWDETAVDVSTLDNADVKVIAPDGAELTATFVGVDDATDGIRRVATYRVNAPNGAWGANDNGAYTVEINPGEVSDTGGLGVTGGAVGAFDVAVAAEVTASVTGPDVAQVGVAATFTLAASTTSTFDPTEVFTFDVDFDGDGTVDQSVNPTGESFFSNVRVYEPAAAALSVPPAQDLAAAVETISLQNVNPLEPATRDGVTALVAAELADVASTPEMESAISAIASPTNELGANSLIARSADALFADVDNLLDSPTSVEVPVGASIG